MPWSRPFFAEVLERVRTDFESYVGRFPRRARAAEAFAQASARVAHGLQGHLAYVVSQMLPDTTIDELTLRWARLRGLRPRPGNRATGSASFAAPSDVRIPEGTPMKILGVEFVATDTNGWAAGVTTVGIRAVDPGPAGNMVTADPVLLQSPIAGVAAEGTVDLGGTTGGTDPDSVEQLRERLLYRVAHPDRGGAAGDYVAWALEVPGVRRAWEFPERTAPRTVDVRFVIEVEGDPYMMALPNSDQITAVAQHIDGVGPVTTDVDVDAVTLQPQLFEIAITPDAPAVRAAVEAELRRMFYERTSPGGTIPLSAVHEAISNAAGEQDHDLVSPVVDIVAASADDLPVFGTVAWS
jgi:uncharacterized phage protein gp47/JayE